MKLLNAVHEHQEDACQDKNKNAVTGITKKLLASQRSYIGTMQASVGRIAGIKDKNAPSQHLQKGTCQEEAFKCCYLKLSSLNSCFL